MNWKHAWSSFVAGFKSTVQRRPKSKEFTIDLHVVHARRLQHAKDVVNHIIRMEQDVMRVEYVVGLKNFAEEAFAIKDYPALDAVVVEIHNQMQQVIERNTKRFDELNQQFQEKASDLLATTLHTQETAEEITRIARMLREQLESAVEQEIDPCVIMQLGCEALDAL